MNIAIYGSHSGSNKGDVAILESIINEINNRFDNCNILVPSKRPKYLNNLLPVENVSYIRAQTNYLGTSTLSTIRNSDLVIIGGGGLFFERKLIDIGYNHMTNIYIINKICEVMNTDTYLFSVGIDEMSGIIPKKMLKNILGNTQKITVRDSNSKEIAQKYTKSEVDLSYDPALLLNGNNIKETIPYEIEEEHNVVFFVKDIDVNRKLLNEYVKCLNEISKKFDNVYVMQTRTEQNLSERIDHLTKDSVKNLISENNMTGSEHISLISKFDAAVCVPMHSSIFSYCSTTPFVSIEYQNKVKEFSKIIDNDMSVDIERLDKVPKMVSNLHNQNLRNPSEIRENAKMSFDKLENSINNI